MSAITQTPKVVVESPYAANEWFTVEDHLTYLRACLRDSVLRGESPYASHGLLTQEGVLNDEIREERNRGIIAGHAWYPVANKIVFYADFGVSRGMDFSLQRLWMTSDEWRNKTEVRFLNPAREAEARQNHKDVASAFGDDPCDWEDLDTPSKLFYCTYKRT